MSTFRITRADCFQRLGCLGLVAAGMLMLMIPANAQAQYTYATNADNTITITKYTGTDSYLNITNTINGLMVTSIGTNAFYLCTNLTSVTILNSVTNIGNWAFVRCGLTSVTIPNSVTSLGVGAFGWCNSLTNVTIGTSVTDISGVFPYCLSLTSVTIPSSVTSIGYNAFEYCPSLATITIPASVTNIGMQAFAECISLTNIYFRGNLPSLYWISFASDANITFYGLPGTTGWSNNFTTYPISLWRPQICSSCIQSNQFSFNINWASGMVAVVECSTNLLTSSWQPVQTNSMQVDTVYFSDPNSAQYPTRFYRVSWTN